MARLSVLDLARRRARRPLVFWLLAVLLAALTGLTVNGLVARAESAADRWGERRAVTVAEADLPRGHVVGPGDVAVRPLPAALLPDGWLEVAPVGRTITAPVLRGEPLVEARLGPEGLGGVAALLPPGTRGVAVPVGPAAIRLRVGDVVDVLAAFDPAAAGDGEPAFPVARAALVVDVTEGATTIAVAETDAPRVAFAATQGVVVLALSGTASPG